MRYLDIVNSEAKGSIDILKNSNQLDLFAPELTIWLFLAHSI